MREKFVVVSYDIKDDAVRSDIALRLQYHGLKREQYSVFIGNIESQKYEQMIQELLEFDLEEEDKIISFELCKNCQKKIKFVDKERYERTGH
ncbi:MAG: CRISPR-associated endonuclease Cas2, partial [Methanosarcinales archaeon]